MSKATGVPSPSRRRSTRETFSPSGTPSIAATSPCASSTPDHTTFDEAAMPARFMSSMKSVSLTSDCGVALAGIHSISSDGLPNLPVSMGHDQLDKYERIYREFDLPRPVFELAFSWLRRNTPPPAAPVLVHGDFRLGNLIVNETGLAAVLDWELAHIGDPREDIAWICVNSWRFGQAGNRVGGFGQLDALLEAYSAAGGRTFPPSDIDWWEVLGSLKWGVMCMIMYSAFRTGADPSVERAAIGRRVSETEIDLINLFERLARHV